MHSVAYTYTNTYMYTGMHSMASMYTSTYMYSVEHSRCFAMCKNSLSALRQYFVTISKKRVPLVCFEGRGSIRGILQESVGPKGEVVVCMGRAVGESFKHNSWTGEGLAQHQQAP